MFSKKEKHDKDEKHEPKQHNDSPEVDLPGAAAASPEADTRKIETEIPEQLEVPAPKKSAPKAAPAVHPDSAALAALKLAVSNLLAVVPEHLTTLYGMTPEKHAAYTAARAHARGLADQF